MLFRSARDGAGLHRFEIMAGQDENVPQFGVWCIFSSLTVEKQNISNEDNFNPKGCTPQGHKVNRGVANTVRQKDISGRG